MKHTVTILAAFVLAGGCATSSLRSPEALVRERLEKTILPDVTFVDADIKAVAAYLESASIEFRPAEADPAMVTVSVDWRAIHNLASPKVTFHAENISLLEVLQQVCKKANVHFVIQPTVVITRDKRRSNN